jgi:hypothetical protein
MKHNGVVTRILKTSSTASGPNAGSAAKARPAVVAPSPPVLPKNQDVDNIVAGISDLTASPGRPPPFASNMEREIADLLSRGGTRGRTPTPADAKETPLVPPPAPVIVQPPITAKEGDRVTVRAPGHEAEEASDGPHQVPPPPRPPPLPAELRDAVTARQGRPLPPLPARTDILPGKTTSEPARVQVKPPPLPLPLGPRRDVHVDVIDAPAETRREPCRRERREVPVEIWTDTSLVESVPPSDPNEVLSPRRPGAGGGQRGTFKLGGQAIVLYGAAGDAADSIPMRPALPPALPPGPAPQPAAAQAPVVVHPASPPPTAWVQQPTTTPQKPLRARLQAAALGIAAGVAISMVVTWQPPTTPSTSAYGLGAAPDGAAAMMTPGRPAAKPSAAAISSAPSAEPTSPPAVQTAAQASATKDPRSRVTPPASAQTSAKPVLTGTLPPSHGPQSTAQGSAAAPATPVKPPSLSGRVTGDEDQ